MSGNDNNNLGKIVRKLQEYSELANSSLRGTAEN